MSLLNVTQREKTDNKLPTRYFSKKQENAIAKTFNGSRQLNSGATPFQKGDVKLKNILLECKTKTSLSESISIKKEWLEKNAKEALFMGKHYSALAFNYGPNQENYYIINEELMEYLVEYLENKNERN